MAASYRTAYANIQAKLPHPNETHVAFSLWDYCLDLSIYILGLDTHYSLALWWLFSNALSQCPWMKVKTFKPVELFEGLTFFVYAHYVRVYCTST